MGKYLSSFSTFLITALLCGSCVSEKLELLTGDITVKMRIAESELQTKSLGEDETQIGELALSGNVPEGISLVAYVTDNREQPFFSGTKGTITTDAGINANGQSFAVEGYLSSSIASVDNSSAADKANYHFINGRQLDYNSTRWEWYGGNDPEWRNAIATTFWSYYPLNVDGRTIHLPAGSTPTDTDQKSISFDYTLPAPATSTPYNDAVAQQDLLFAYNLETRSYKKDGTMSSASGSRSDQYIDIHFYHALAAVKFDITDIAEDLTIKNISIINAASEGKCQMIGPLGVGSSHFVWSTSGAALKTYSQDFVTSGAGSDFETVDGRNTQKTSGNKIFFMIPQSTSGISVKITLDDNSTFTASLDDPIHPYAWEAGKYYTYALQKSNDNLSLELLGEGGVLKTSAADAHFENAILKFSKTAPDSYSLNIVKPDGTTSTAAADAAWLSFARPASATAFASYPGASATVGIADLIAELKGTGDKSHFLSDGGYYYTQAFIDEYYYAGQSLASFVNKNDRSVKISINKGDKEASATIAQSSIKSPYYLSSSNPLGVEMIEESDVASGSDPCADRNRGGSGPWRQPSLQEYYYLWYGNKTLVAAGWTALSDAGYATADTGVKGRYDGVASTWGPLSGNGRVRCVRDLGSGASSPMYSINSTDRIVTMQNVGTESLRATAKTGEYPAHTVTDDANLLPSKFKVATMNQKYKTGTYTKIDLPSDFCINLSMDTEQVPYISKGTPNTVVQGGKIKLNPYDEVFYFTATFVGAQGAKEVVSNTVTITKDGYMSFDLEINWSAGNNAYLEWRLQPHYVDPEGVDQTLGNPSVLYLVMNNSGAPGNIGANDDQSKRPGAKIVSNTITSNGGSYKWYFSLKTEPASGQSYQKPEYDEFYTPVGVSDNGCAEYYEEQAFDALNNKMIYPDLGKWRVPNQRELSIMLMNASALGLTLDATPEPHYSSKTTYNSRPYYYYNGEYTTTGGNLTGKDFKIRCVRDID